MLSFVGCSRVNLPSFVDEADFGTLILYPSKTPSREVEFGPFSMDVAMEAVISDGNFPLVVISHGSSSSNMMFRTLAHFLAKNGFVVCLPEHFGDTVFDNKLQYTIENMTNRPNQISKVIDFVFDHPDFSYAVNTKNVAVIGHSVGGYTAIAVAGGDPHTEFLNNFCNRPENYNQPYWTKIVRDNNLPSQSINVKADDRVTSIVLLAPDISLFMHEGALSSITLPTLLIVAEKDLWVQETLDTVSDGIGDKSKLKCKIIKNASHYSFISSFPEGMKSRVGQPAIDPVGFDRDQFQLKLQEEVMNFIASN